MRVCHRWLFYEAFVAIPLLVCHGWQSTRSAFCSPSRLGFVRKSAVAVYCAAPLALSGSGAGHMLRQGKVAIDLRLAQMLCRMASHDQQQLSTRHRAPSRMVGRAS